MLHELHLMLVDRVDNLLTQYSSHHLIILGDFNHFNTDSLCNDFDLFDLIDKATRKDRILDHCLISRDLADVYLSENVIYDAPISTSDHLMLTAIPVGRFLEARRSRLHVVYDFRKSNLDALNSKVCHVNWDEIIKSEEDVDLLWRKFLSVIQQTITEVIPSKRVWMPSSDKEWMTPVSKMLINERWNAYRRRD